MLTMWRAENHLFSSDKIFRAQHIGVLSMVLPNRYNAFDSENSY